MLHKFSVKMNVVNSAGIVDVHVHDVISRAALVNDATAVGKNPVVLSFAERNRLLAQCAQLLIERQQLLGRIHPI